MNKMEWKKSRVIGSLKLRSTRCLTGVEAALRTEIDAAGLAGVAGAEFGQAFGQSHPNHPLKPTSSLNIKLKSEQSRSRLRLSFSG